MDGQPAATTAMFSKLPDAVVCAIFESTSSLSASAKLARCSRRLSGLWRAHLATLNLAHTFDDDPRWRGPKYRFFAVSIARATLEDSGGRGGGSDGERRAGS